MILTFTENLTAETSWILHINIPIMHHNNVPSGSALCWMNTHSYSMLHEWIFKLVVHLAETGTGRHVVMMHYGNGDEPNEIVDWWCQCCLQIVNGGPLPANVIHEASSVFDENGRYIGDNVGAVTVGGVTAEADVTAHTATDTDVSSFSISPSTHSL